MRHSSRFNNISRHNKSGLFKVVPLMVGGVFTAIVALTGLEVYWSTADKYEEDIKFELVNMRENRGSISTDSDGGSSQSVSHFITVKDLSTNKMRTLQVANNVFRNELHKNSMLTEFEYARGRECSYSGKLSHPESFPLIEVYKNIYKATEIECKKKLDASQTIQIVR